MRHIISPTDLTISELDELLNLAEDIIKDPKKYSKVCQGKKLATLFYEPSTRTRLSFEAAMLNLGGSILNFSSADSSSVAKAKALPIQFALFLLTQIYVQFVIPRKVLL